MISEKEMKRKRENFGNNFWERQALLSMAKVLHDGSQKIKQKRKKNES